MSAIKLAGPMVARILAVALIAVSIGSSAQANDKWLADAEAKMALGDDLSGNGQFSGAIVRWQEAGQLFKRAKVADGEVHALLRQAAACQSLGRIRLAVTALNAADLLAADSGEERLATEVKAERGAIVGSFAMIDTRPSWMDN